MERMGGEGTPWSAERAQRSLCPVARLLSSGKEHVVHDRTSAHTAAWWSPKRPAEEAGLRFKIHDCRRVRAGGRPPRLGGLGLC